MWVIFFLSSPHSQCWFNYAWQGQNQHLPWLLGCHWNKIKTPSHILGREAYLLWPYSTNDNATSFHNKTTLPLSRVSHFTYCYAECRYAECREAIYFLSVPPTTGFEPSNNPQSINLIIIIYFLIWSEPNPLRLEALTEFSRSGEKMESFDNLELDKVDRRPTVNSEPIGEKMSPLSRIGEKTWKYFGTIRFFYE